MSLKWYFVISLVVGALAAALSKGEEVRVSPGERITLTKGSTPRVPTDGQHRTLICEQHGCGCGCLRGGACLCHPGWEKSADGWYFYRERGVEKAGFDSKSNRYWKKVNGKWVEWVDEVRATPTLAPIIRMRRGSSC